MASDNVKIAFGVVAAAGVVFVSYVFFRIFGTKTNDRPSSKRKAKAKKSEPVIEAKIGHTSSTSKAQRTEASRLPTQEDSQHVDLKDDLSYDNSNQTSFIVIDQATRESLPGDEGPPSSKKSDRSSDDSSFDVVEAAGDEEDEEKKHQDETLLGRSLEGPLIGDNESSMVIVDSDPSGIECSSSSFYRSADETLSREKINSQGKKMVGGSSKGAKEEPELSEAISTSDSEATVMYSVEGKQPIKGGDSEVTDVSRTKGDIGPSAVKDSLATGDEKKMASDSDSNSSVAMQTGDAGESISEKTASLASSAMSSDEKAKQSALESQKVLTSAETARTLTVCQNSASTVSKVDIFNLVELLRAKNASLQEAVLDCIVRVSVFSHNNKHLCDAGCGWVLSQQVQESCSAAVQGDASAQTSLEALSDALTNLSMSPMFQSQLEESVSPLIDVFLLESLPESVQMSTLRPLTNFSSESTFHHLYKKGIHQLYSLLDKGAEPVRLQCLKVLVNLSLNQDIVPYLLSAKSPSTLLDLVDASASNDLVLRTVTMLGNIYASILRAQLSQSSLPTDEKVESPNTLFTALCGVAEVPLLRNKVYLLTRHQNGDIKKQASKLYHFITEIKK